MRIVRIMEVCLAFVIADSALQCLIIIEQTINASYAYIMIIVDHPVRAGTLPITIHINSATLASIPLRFCQLSIEFNIILYILLKS